MKYLIVGLGSMGKRRIRNLQYLDETDVIGFDLRKDRRKESEEKYHIKTYATIEQAMNQDPDALIISTPPDHHLEYQMLAAKNKKHFFSEASMFRKGIAKLDKLAKKNKIIAAPSSTLRYNESVKKIKEVVENKAIGKVILVTYHMGQYLPDWHPWEHIKDYYAGQTETSAAKEMVAYELEWLIWVFGDIKEISCIKGKISNLDADIDDTYQLIFQFKNNAIGNLLSEVVSRTPLRVLRVVGEEGTIVWDWLEGKVKIYETKTKKWTEYKEDKGFKEKGYLAKENMYIDELKSFIEKIKGKNTYSYTLQEDLKILRLLDAAVESSEKKRHIIIH
ncbi:MAG: hypothetical protein A2V69_00255 [Candidatus Portnoybacteria bacterium RBG_13_40_8]|uniref:Gfo/Idh/MocA-like oxidoreductase N-terminal domain-containing protein n=1 Tax=Candidatus Portnoybacteria bacterium RBG_13_40_8 TaxID=1801990 RepID=A0A1G2F299_9BACT|nr:MAG: hypothetical protein A2V69_00255 [Candidatus Portnoybacteria bacterium RBG_13_40_8]